MSDYQDYVRSLTPNHYTDMDGDAVDSGFGSAYTTPNPTATDATYDNHPLTAGAVHSVHLQNSARLDFGDANDVNVTGSPWFRRTYSVWAETSSFDNNFSIFSEGGSVRNMTIMFGIGGVPVYIADNDSDSDEGCPWSQAVVGPNLKLNTPYHFGMIWESDRADTGPEGKGRSYLRAFLNGRFIQEKEIYKWDTSANEEILTEPGGQLNAHSGNIELGGARSIIVSKKVFSTGALTGYISDNAIWDNVILTDDQMWQLFVRGATDTTTTVTFTNVPVGSEIRAYNIDGNGHGTTEAGTGIETSVANTFAMDYTVASTIDLRIIIISPDYTIFSKIVTLPREDSTLDVSLLMREDRNYSNP